MKKERKVIEPSATIVFDRNVSASELAKLPSDFKGDIIIDGMLYLDEPAIIKCDTLYARAVVADRAEVYIIGDVITAGDINVYDITVNGSVYCQCNMYATNVSISGDCIVKNEFDGDSIWLSSLEVYGDFTAEIVKNVSSIMVMGIFKSNIAFECIEVEISIDS